MARVSQLVGLLALVVRAAEASRPSHRVGGDEASAETGLALPSDDVGGDEKRAGRSDGVEATGLLQATSSRRQQFQATASGKFVIQDSSTGSDLLEVVRSALPMVRGTVDKFLDKLAKDADFPEAPMVVAMKTALDLLQGFLQSSTTEDHLEGGLSLDGELPGMVCFLGILQGALLCLEVLNPIPPMLIQAFVTIKVKLDALLSSAAHIENMLRRILAKLDMVLMHLDALHELQIEAYMKTDKASIWILGDHFQKGLRMLNGGKNSSEMLQVFRPLAAEDRARSDQLRAVFVDNMELLASCEVCGGKAAAALWYHQALAARFQAFSILHTVSLLERNFAVMEQDLIDLNTDLQTYNDRSAALDLRPWLQLNPEDLVPYVEVPYAQRKVVTQFRATLRTGSMEEKEGAAQNLSLLGPRVAAPAVSTLRYLLRNLNFTASLADQKGHCIPSKARSAGSWWQIHKLGSRLWTLVDCEEPTAARFQFQFNHTSGGAVVLLPPSSPGCTGPGRGTSRPRHGFCVAQLRSKSGSTSDPLFEIPLGPSGGSEQQEKLGVTWHSQEKVEQVEACWACQEDDWKLVRVHSPECICAVEALWKLGGPAGREAVPELRGLARIASLQEFPCGTRAAEILIKWTHKK